MTQAKAVKLKLRHWKTVEKGKLKGPAYEAMAEDSLQKIYVVFSWTPKFADFADFMMSCMQGNVKENLLKPYVYTVYIYITYMYILQQPTS